MDYSKQKIFFQKAYELGDERIKSGYGWPVEVDKQVVKFFNHIKKFVYKGKSLDLGCGQGRHTIFFAEKGLNSYGIDYIPRVITEAKQQAKSKGLKNVRFVLKDILNLDFPKYYFDLILDWSVLDHIHPKDWQKYLNNILRVLKINGYLILTEFSAEDSRIVGKTQNYKIDRNSYDHYFKVAELKEIFSPNFKFIKIQTTTLATKTPHSMVNVLLKRIL